MSSALPAAAILLLAAAVLPCACDRGADRAAAGQSHPRDAELHQLVRRSLDMHDALAVGASRAGSDCAAMARSFTEVLASHRDLLGTAELDGDPALRVRFDQLLAEHADRQKAWALQFGKAIKPCAADPRVSAALAPLENSDLLRAD